MMTWITCEVWKSCAPMHAMTENSSGHDADSDNEFKQTMFHIENARLLSKSAVFCLVNICFPKECTYTCVYTFPYAPSSHTLLAPETCHVHE